MHDSRLNYVNGSLPSSWLTSPSLHNSGSEACNYVAIHRLSRFSSPANASFPCFVVSPWHSTNVVTGNIFLRSTLNAFEISSYNSQPTQLRSDTANSFFVNSLSPYAHASHLSSTALQFTLYSVNNLGIETRSWPPDAMARLDHGLRGSVLGERSDSREHP